MKWRRWWSESHKWLVEKNEQVRRGQIGHIEWGLKIEESKGGKVFEKDGQKVTAGCPVDYGVLWSWPSVRLAMAAHVFNSFKWARCRPLQSGLTVQDAEMSVGIVSKDSVTVGGVGANAGGHQWEVATHPGELTSRWMGRHHLHTYGQFCLSSWPNMHVLRLWE